MGYAVTGPIDHEGLEVELGYAISPWGRGRGVATETLLQLTRWAFDAGMQRVTRCHLRGQPRLVPGRAEGGLHARGVLRSVHQVGDRRGDMESWSILPGELPAS